jgi:hypothetical protein
LLEQIEEQLDNTIEVDELFLRKLRRLIRVDISESNFYYMNVPVMVVGTILVIIGWCIMASSGTGTSHTLNNALAR